MEPTTTQPPVAAPAPGWYSDPLGDPNLKVYWDGARWTEHCQDLNGNPVTRGAQASSGGNAGATPKKSTPWWRRWWAIALAAVVVIAIASSGSSSTTSTSSSGSSSAGVATSDGSDDADQADASTSGDNSDPEKPNNASGDNTPHVAAGQPVTVDGLVYNVESAKTANALGGQYTRTRADGVFVVVNLSVHSTKGETVQLSDDTFKLEVPGGATYDADSEGTTAALLSSDGDSSGEPFFLRDVQPDTTTRGVIVFDVPQSVLAQKPELRFNELGFGETHAYIALSSL
jgi:hypothetical protein